MPTTEKILFTRSFDLPKPITEEVTDEEELEEEPEIIIPTFSQEELDAARAEGIATGREEGIREASEATERLIGETTQSINTQLETLFNQQHNTNAEIFKDAINVGIAVVKKCFPQMNAKHGVDEIEGMISKILSQILEEPRVVINVHDDTKEPLNKRMEAITKSAHFDGRVVLRGAADILPGDCRIEWSNGGAERDMGQLWHQIDTVIEENLTAAAEGMEFESLHDPIADTPAIAQSEIPDETEISSESIEENIDTQDDSDALATEAPEAEAELKPAPIDDVEIPSGPPPTPSIDDGDQPENTQNSALSEVSGDDQNDPENDPVEAQNEVAENTTPAQPEEDQNAGMEPQPEVGILTDNSDVTPSNASEPPGGSTDEPQEDPTAEQ